MSVGRGVSRPFYLPAAVGDSDNVTDSNPRADASSLAKNRSGSIGSWLRLTVIPGSYEPVNKEVRMTCGDEVSVVFLAGGYPGSGSFF